MTTGVFGADYSGVYDVLYGQKDYDAECDFLETLFRRNKGDIKTILDLGCGTGGHLIPLAKRGYRVTGVDRSEHMLKTAHEKVSREKIDCELIPGDICSIDLGRRFDAIISMFAVMSYQTANRSIAAACRTAFNHLKSPGLFIFDGWYGPAVLKDNPVQKLKRVSSGATQIIRFTDPVLDVESHTVDVRFSLLVIEGEKIVSMDEESHFMRFFFPLEIAYFLDVAGFDRVHFCPFMKADDNLSDTDWNITVIGEK